MVAQGSDKKELLRLVPLRERKFQSSERKCVVHLLQREMAYDEKMSQEMEIVSNLRPIVFGLKVRTRGPQPSICVRTFSLFTKCFTRRRSISHAEIGNPNTLLCRCALLLHRVHSLGQWSASGSTCDAKSLTMPFSRPLIGCLRRSLGSSRIWRLALTWFGKSAG